MKAVLTLLACTLLCFARASVAQTTDAGAETRPHLPFATKTSDGSRFLTSQAAQNEWKPESESTSSLPVRVIEGLLLCGAMIAGGVFVLKKLGYNPAPAKGRRLKVLEKIALTTKTALVVVDHGGKTLVLSVGPDRVTLVDEHEEWMGKRATDSEIPLTNAVDTPHDEAQGWDEKQYVQFGAFKPVEES